MRSARLLLSIALTGVLLAAGSASLQSAPRFARVSQRMDTSATPDPVARLRARIESGAVVLQYDSTLGYLPALLRELKIPASSQGLVFSRTSLQTDKITPWSPRAVYFNDDVYVGYVLDGYFLELAAVDPRGGVEFYTMSQEGGKRPTFAREGSTCLMCHQSSATGNVPGLMVRSTLADRHGYPIAGAHEGTTTDATPIRQRWGGWYVTGTHGKAGHSGNVFAPLLGHEIADKERYRSQVDLTAESERTELAGKFDPSAYLTRHSDIVALMVLVHQTTVHNLLTAVHEAARAGEPETYGAAPPSAGPTGAVTSVRLRTAVDHLLRGMLFSREAKPDAPIRGTTTFVQDFTALGPADAQGRSLREFDLERRLFKYPMSFLVYSESFASLPPIAKREFYTRLRRILNGEDTSAEFAHLQAAERTAIREILTATLPEFAQHAAR